MEKKYLSGNLTRNIAFGLTWLLSALTSFGWIAAIVLLLIDKDVLDIEDKRELVSVIIVAALAYVLAITLIVPFAAWVCSIIACVMAFTAKPFKIPGVYQIAAAIIK